MKLIFVYNADSGMFGAMTDAAHKILSPKTYACNLCKLTYGAVSMKRDWSNFIKSLPGDVEFLHKDELKHKYGITNEDLPVILKGDLSVFVSTKEINSAKSLDDLKKIILTKFK